jgi:hypothetical protein
MNNRLFLKLAKPKKAKPGTWPRLSSPVDWEETHLRSRAQSILCGVQFRDGSSQCPALSLSQAQDVLRWATQHPKAG